VTDSCTGLDRLIQILASAVLIDVKFQAEIESLLEHRLNGQDLLWGV
jgi:hypothetical protein